MYYYKKADKKDFVKVAKLDREVWLKLSFTERNFEKDFYRNEEDRFVLTRRVEYI